MPKYFTTYKRGQAERLHGAIKAKNEAEAQDAFYLDQVENMLFCTLVGVKYSNEQICDELSLLNPTFKPQ